ncbi:MAG TPA: tetratricopeptide repeat protein [Humisphaera sp.]
MFSVTPINPTEFVSSLRPYLQGQDLSGMVAHIRTRWDHRQIAQLFDCGCPDTRKVAALAYGLVGGRCCVEQLAPLLKDPDPVVAQMAEHAMWSVWLRMGTDEANHEVCRGTRALNRRDYEHAIDHFTRATELDPTFAEAYNQRAIAKFLLERYDECADDCREAVRLMPCHFGALAGLGHCHAHAGKLVPALKCYEKALAINPRMDDVRQTVTELRAELCPTRDECE